jgi:L-lysine 2,3-aminomutase
MQTNERLATWLDTLADVPQLDFIRIGSRTPVTFPCRITEDPALLELFSRIGEKKQLYLITHFNHPREVSEQAVAAVHSLMRSGVIVKNQTVLLKGVNDDPEVLALLLRKMTSTGVVQHYIFQCRPVVGATNYFQVPLIEGSRIVNAANSLQNGLGKCADYTMSHKTGKIRILGETGEGELLFQYKQAKDPSQIGKLFTRKMNDGQAWL